VARPGAGKIFRQAGVADRILTLDLAAGSRPGRVARKLAALARLRLGRFDLGVVSYINSNAETSVLLRLAGVRRRAGYTDSLATPSLFDLAALRPGALAGRRAAARHLDLLPVLGIDAAEAGVPRFVPGEAARRAAAALLAAAGEDRPGRIAGLHPGCGAGMSWKRWPIERFAALADRLADQGVRVWIFGGPEEEALAVALRERMRHPATAWSAVADLEVAAALMERCSIFVANDSGLYNLALALPVPVVALFGPSPEAVSGPWATGRPAVVLTHHVPCHPCYDHLRPPAALPCPIDRACLTGVSVEEAHAACLAVLGIGHVEDGVAAAAGATP
jgi:heptosyltransferase-2